jgi:hypothetical protein
MTKYPYVKPDPTPLIHYPGAVSNVMILGNPGEDTPFGVSDQIRLSRLHPQMKVGAHKKENVLLSRQREAESGAQSKAVRFHPNPPAMNFDDPLDQG